MNKTQTVEERLSMILNNLITCSSNIGLGEEYFIVSLSMCFGKRNKSKPMIDDLMDKVVSKIKQELKANDDKWREKIKDMKMKKSTRPLFVKIKDGFEFDMFSNGQKSTRSKEFAEGYNEAINNLIKENK